MSLLTSPCVSLHTQLRPIAWWSPIGITRSYERSVLLLRSSRDALVSPSSFVRDAMPETTKLKLLQNQMTLPKKRMSLPNKSQVSLPNEGQMSLPSKNLMSLTKPNESSN